MAAVVVVEFPGLKQVPGLPPSNPLVVAFALSQGKVPVPTRGAGVPQVSLGTPEVWVMLSSPGPTAELSFQLPT